ncbi:MAG: TIGR03032 family protein [Planctomycetota bacterium]|jgi:uncharacterized protein (TIGR03032 family)
MTQPSSHHSTSGSRPSEKPFHYVHSDGLAELLSKLGVSLWVTTYQAGKLVVVRSAGGRVSTLLRSLDRPMGVAVRPGRLAVGTRNQVWLFRNAPEIGSRLGPAGRFDACFVPRASHVTGNVRGHEIAWGGDELWMVNTRFSCLATLAADYSFVPRWRPPFVSALAAEDRCHLNGLAMVDGRPKYVTALGETDTAEGWREDKIRGGCVVDVPSGQTVVGGLCMPHSPRVYRNRLWLLDSGHGRLVAADPANGRCEVVAELPGYARGLAFAGRYALVGLSRIRETSTFGGMPIADRLDGLKCGVWIVDLDRVRTAAFLEFDRGVREIFDVQVLPGAGFPAVVGFQKRTINSAFVIPPNGMAADIGPGSKP